jgi:hypothetical protein
MDVPSSNTGNDHLRDFPGDIIRLHERIGFRYVARYHVWKEPLGLRNRTMAKNLAHKSIVEDSSRCSVASADYLLMFRRTGENPLPIQHPNGLLEYAGERQIPTELQSYRGWTGNQIENRYSQWIWRQYASAFWDDVRIGRVLPFKAARDTEDERHVHPLQLDVIERCLALWSNPGEVVLSPFMGVGSEIYAAVGAGRRGVGVELKESYYRQAVKNVATAGDGAAGKQHALFGPKLLEIGKRIEHAAQVIRLEDAQKRRSALSLIESACADLERIAASVNPKPPSETLKRLAVALAEIDS